MIFAIPMSVTFTINYLETNTKHSTILFLYFYLLSLYIYKYMYVCIYIYIYIYTRVYVCLIFFSVGMAGQNRLKCLI